MSNTGERAGGGEGRVSLLTVVICERFYLRLSHLTYGAVCLCMQSHITKRERLSATGKGPFKRRTQDLHV